MSEALINEAICYVKKMFESNSDGHDLEHSLRVYHNALKIASEERDCDIDIISLAALLHDVDDTKLFDTTDNQNAMDFLNGHGIDDEKIEMICEIINSVSFSHNRGRKPATLEGMIVQDADRLDAMGAIGIARTYAYGGSHGRSLELSKQHFYDKLLLLKDEMNTQTGKKIALSRHEFLESFLKELNKESEC